MRWLGIGIVLLIIGCGESHDVKTFADPPQTVRIEEILPSAADATDEVKIGPIEKTITPEQTGATKYAFHFNWTLAAHANAAFSVWHFVDGKAAKREGPRQLFALYSELGFESGEYQLRWGHLHEFEIRVLTDKALDLISDLKYEEAKKDMKLARTLRIDLTGGGK
jgi:hypothetical protein